MDVRKKLVEMSEQLRYCANVSDCVNCKRWDKVCENQCVDNLLLMAADLIDSVAHGVTVQKWIPVTERLPEDLCPVLVSLKGLKKVFVGRYQDSEWWSEGASSRPFMLEVTHWMPQPSPPKEG